MADELNNGDGSIDGAVGALNGIDFDALVPFDQAQQHQANASLNDEQPWLKQQRQTDGKFAKQPDPTLKTPPPNDKTTEHLGAKEEGAEEEGEVAGDVGEEWFELPPEKEGEAPRRIAAEEVFNGYQRSQELEEEIEELRRSSPPPEEWDSQIAQTVKERGALIQKMTVYRQMLTPPEPDVNLLNQEHPNYNPQQYHNQIVLAQRMREQLALVEREIGELSTAQENENRAIAAARMERERGKLRQIWPEVVGDAKKAAEVRDWIAREIGISPQELSGIVDARFYKLAKLAFTHHTSQKAQKAAIKVVRGKPKLVRSTARSSGDAGKQTQTNNAMQRLSRSGSIEDAASAIGGLL